MIYQRLRRLETDGQTIRVAVVGAGFVGRGLIHQLRLTPGMSCSLVVARTPSQATAAYIAAGHEPERIVASEEPTTLAAAINDGLPTVTTDPSVLTAIDEIDVVVEATGDVAHGAHVALLALSAGKHLVSLNYETDATVGPLLRMVAEQNDVVYTGSDGDQPGVMMRLVEYVRGIGLDVVVAVNCKGFLDIHATPQSIAPWAKKQRTSPKMTTAFTDGTKMNVENVSVANATGLIPEKRGMHGIETTLSKAIEDFESTLDGVGVVDFTLGGDFGSGVFVIGSGADPDLAAPYLSYLKMGPGPWYLFYRPWHLVQFETPISIAEAALDGTPTIAPWHDSVAQVVTIAKRNLEAGRTPDGIGGFDCYGEADTLERSKGLLPMGLADQSTLTRAVPMDDPIRLDHVELHGTPLVRLWEAQQAMLDDRPEQVDPRELVSLWETAT